MDKTEKDNGRSEYKQKGRNEETRIIKDRRRIWVKRKKAEDTREREKGRSTDKQEGTKEEARINKWRRRIRQKGK